MRGSHDSNLLIEMVRKQLDFLKGTLCADESLWGTIAGNPERERYDSLVILVKTVTCMFVDTAKCEKCILSDKEFKKEIRKNNKITLRTGIGQNN